MSTSRFIAIVLLAIFIPSRSHAQPQTPTGAIQGTVLDSSGASSPGVRITTTQTASGLVHTAETDPGGQFRIAGLPVGDYKLRLDKEGFASVEVKSFPVSVGQTVVHRLQMNVAQLSEKVEVRESPDALETTASTSGVALGGERIDEGPANNRNYLNFVLVAPGVAASANSNAQRAAAAVRSANVDSGFSFGGMRGRNNSLSIDGVENRDETTGANRVSIGLEEVAEFRVSGVSVGAELGGAAGGVVNVVTYSGTNLWHGDATFFAQNEIANARNPEAFVSGRPRFRRYQPGASINGPIQKDRTFFSTAVEQEWESSEEFSEAPASVQSLLNRALLDPRFARAAVHAASEGLFRAGSSQTQASFKITHQAGGKHSLMARYAFSRGRESQDVQDVDNFMDRSARGSSLTTDHSFVSGWIAAISPSVVNDLRLQIAQRTAGITPNSRGAMLEIPGVVTLGQSYRLDQSRTENHYEIVEALNLAIGRHQLSIGGGLQSIRLDARLANRFGGLFVFPALAAFLAGRPDMFSQAFGDPRTHVNTLPASVWLQDRWQARTGLTIEAGLRYDHQKMPSGIPATNRNLAPRLGFAYRPGGTAPFVIRAGFGFFYDRYPLAFLNDAIQKDGVHAFEQYATGDLAAQAFASSLGGSLTAPLAGQPVSRYIASRNFPGTYSRKLTAGLERSIDKNTTASIEASWVEGYHLPRLRNIAAAGLPPLYLLEQNARSSYRGAAISVNRRFSNELAFLVAYNLGRTRDDASDFDEQPLDPSNLRRDWARSRQHQLQRFTASGLFELPAEELQSAPQWLKDSFEHIVVAPIFTYGSGRPINALATTDLFRTGAYPISARPFDLARNPFYSPATISMDLRIMKGFPLRNNRAILQTGVESFNLTNHTNPLRVSPYYAAGANRLPNYGGIVEALNARQLQLMIQIEY